MQVPVILVLFASFVSTAVAQPIARLKPETLEGFNRYVKIAEESLKKRWEKQIPALWLYENQDNRTRAIQGEIVTERLSDHQMSPLPGGLIHDWVGAMFIPGTTLDALLDVLQDFNRHKQIYPEVIDSRLIKRDGDTYWCYLQLRKQKILTVVLATEHEVNYIRLDPNRWLCRSYSRRIAEITEPGTQNERELPPGEDHGFLWRLNVYWQLEKVNKGVFVECRALSLTRDVPAFVSWIINPIINELPGESLKNTLEATRKAVQAGKISK